MSGSLSSSSVDGRGQTATAGGALLGHKNNTAMHTSGDRCVCGRIIYVCRGGCNATSILL